MKIKIVGAGLAGLASGIKILENKPNADVEILNMGHHVGGRASSWRDDKGYNINHGFHAIFQNYHQLLALLEKSGVDISKTLIPTQTGYFYEDDTEKVHELGFFPKKTFLRKGYTRGYKFAENLNYLSFFLKNRNTIFKNNTIEHLDDICYTKWAIDNGLDEELTKKRSFRFTRDALFNYPNEISTYITLKSARLVGKGKIYHVDGNYGENIIKPIENYFTKLGGRITLYKKLTRLTYENKRVVSLQFASPDPSVHDFGKKNWPRKVQIVDGSEIEINDFDKVILAIPIDTFKELNPEDKVFWQEFDKINNLQSVATINWQIWLKEQAMPDLRTTLNGLDEPMGSMIDYKNLVKEYKENPELGSVLEFVGQETTFENHSDEEIKNIVMQAFVKIPHCKNIADCGIIHEKFTRNQSNHERYLLTEPGTLQFRPFSKTSYTNLFLAGDWIRNSVDVPTMEGAICSGYEAANLIINPS